MSGHLLVIDDDQALSRILQLNFQELGYTVTTAATLRDGLAAAAGADAPDLVLLDQQLPDGRGIDALPALLEHDASLPVIMMTGVHDLDLAIQAIKGGARDFVHKPVKTGELELTIANALEHRRLLQQLSGLSESQHAAHGERTLIGRSDAMLRVSKEIALTAASATSILLTGESGTGKEVVARAIHQHSGRSGPFVAVNCAAIVDTLLESELFGHEKGAFTGAAARRPGRFELAADGTLFLDEIGDLNLGLQAKLLRVLQEHTYERVGGTHTLASRARIIAATNRDLEEEARKGTFREDLLYRLNVIRIELPALRDRPEDIPLLVGALLDRLAHTLHKPALQVTDAALRRIQTYAWPGNVRELENTLTQCMVRARDRVLTPDMLSIPGGGADQPDPGGDPFAAPAPEATLDQVEALYIQRVLDHTGGHKGRTCEILGISRPALDRKIDKYTLRVKP